MALWCDRLPLHCLELTAMDDGEPLHVSAPLPADFMEALVTMSNVSSEQWQLLMRKGSERMQQ